MRLRVSLIAGLGALFLLVATTRQSRGAETAEVVGKIEALNRAAIASFKAKDYDKARSQLIDALVLGKSNELDTHPVMARTYLHLGVVYLEGLKEKDKALHNFQLALRIRPSIEVTPSLATDDVILEFEDARTGNSASPPSAPEEKVAEAKPSEPEPVEPKPAEVSPATTGRSKASKKEKEKADRKAAAAASAEADEEKLRKSLSAATEVATKEREARQQLQEQKAANDDELTRSREQVAEERAAKDQLHKENLALDKQLAEAKNQLQQAKLALDKRLAVLDQGDKKERQTRDQLQQAKLTLEKQLAEAKELARRERETKEQLQKDKAAAEKQLAAAKENEAKEREAKEKLLAQAAQTRTRLDTEKQTAMVSDKERYDRQEKQRLAREKLADGPDLPAEIPSKIYCPALNGQEGQDIYVRCATHPFLKARTATLYYRTAMAAHYNSLAMERSRKGWFTAVMPGIHVTGKTMHYYIEAMDDANRVVAKEGNGMSPNIMGLRPPSADLIADTSPTADGTATSTQGKARPPRGRSARKRSKTR